MRVAVVGKALVTSILVPWLLGVSVLSATGVRLAQAEDRSRYPTDALHFAAVGDYGSAGQAESDVSNLIHGWNPDLIITLGDNNYDLGEASTIDPNIGQYYHDFIYPYFGTYGNGAPYNKFFPALGNHDWYTSGATPYLNYFTLPYNERYYDFAAGPVHFFAIDSDPNEPDGITSTSVQANWLQGRLAAATEPWKLVYFHHPPYSSGNTHGSTPELQWPFQQWGASAVLAGHEHNYERLIIGGFPYFVNGLGGRSIYGFGTPISGSVVRYNNNYGAMLVDATAITITFQFITRTPTIRDTYTIALAATPTPTITRTNTPTPIQPTPTSTNTPAHTPTTTTTPSVTPTATPTNTVTGTPTEVPVTTSTATSTEMPTNTPIGGTPTPIFVGHVNWQGRPPQPHGLQQLPITLTLKSGTTEINYPSQTTDASGFFTVGIGGLPGGTYDWRVKGPKYLAKTGTTDFGFWILDFGTDTSPKSKIQNPKSVVEMGLILTGDCNNDNVVSVADFTILRGTFGLSAGDTGYDDRADFTGDSAVNIMDFNLLRANFGFNGGPPIRPAR